MQKFEIDDGEVDPKKSRDLVHVVELLTRGKSVEENEEELLKEKAKIDDMQREKFVARAMKKERRGRPKSGR